MSIKDIAKLQAMCTDKEYYKYGPDDADSNSTILQALQDIVFYNGLSEQLKVAREHLLQVQQKIKDGAAVGFDTVVSLGTSRPDSLCSFDSRGNSNDFEQFEIFWMLLVLMFGDYGTSPRYGWINPEQISDAVLFIDWLTEAK